MFSSDERVSSPTRVGRLAVKEKARALLSGEWGRISVNVLPPIDRRALRSVLQWKKIRTDLNQGQRVSRHKQ
jgi:hypothetical protein